MKDVPSETHLNGPAQTDSTYEHISSGLVATMWLCMLTTVDQEHMDALGEAKAEVAYDLGIAAQVAEEDMVPLPDLMAEVFEFYNEQLALQLPSKLLAKLVAESYYHAQVAQRNLH